MFGLERGATVHGFKTHKWIYSLIVLALNLLVTVIWMNVYVNLCVHKMDS